MCFLIDGGKLLIQSYIHKALICLEQSEVQEKVHLGYPHCPEMKQEGWQQQEQRPGAEEEKSQEQMPRSPKDTGQVLWHCEKSEDTSGQQSF